jgi:hypothetical protein
MGIPEVPFMNFLSASTTVALYVLGALEAVYCRWITTSLILAGSRTLNCESSRDQVLIAPAPSKGW